MKFLSHEPVLKDQQANHKKYPLGVGFHRNEVLEHH